MGSNRHFKIDDALVRPSLPDVTLEDRSRAFATEAHRGQVRKYTGEPYITHPEAVARIVKDVDHTEDMIAAALLHDVVEDCPFSIGDIEGYFGPHVAELVSWLTDVSKPEDGNRKTRKAIDREHISKAPAEAQTIKVADLIHNTESIVANDPDFAKVYLREKALLLDVLTLADPILIELARVQVAAIEGN